MSERVSVLDVLCMEYFRRRQKIHEHFRCVNEHVGGAVLDRPVPLEREREREREREEEEVC